MPPITKDRCREETNRSKERWEASCHSHKRIYQEGSAHPITDGRRQEAGPAYPVLQNYDQLKNQTDTEQFNRVPGEYGNRSQHMEAPDRMTGRTWQGRSVRTGMYFSVSSGG